MSAYVKGVWSLLAVATLAPAGAWAAPTTKTKTVDCSKGRSIQEALDNEKADELILEIEGICHEDLVIRRDRVTLRGGDPATDGIRGVADGTLSRDAVVFITDVQHVRIESLSIADGERHGVMTEQGDNVVIVDSEIFDNGRDGLQFDADSSVTVDNTSFSGNARAGIASFGGEIVICTDCTISGSRYGLLLINGVRASFTNGSIDVSEIAVYTSPFATAFVADAALSGPDFSIFAGSSSEVNTFGGSLEGPVYAERGGLVRLNNTPQTSNAPGYNLVQEAATLRLNNGSTLLGYVGVSDFSQAIVTGGSVIDGDLDCQRGGDAFCDAPLTDVTGTSNCSQCPNP